MKVDIYGSDSCSWCERAKELCESKDIEFTYHDIGMDIGKRDFIVEQGLRTVPQCFVGDQHIGGYERLAEYLS